MLDHEAYQNESPLPSSERAYLYYLRSSKKLGVRRNDHNLTKQPETLNVERKVAARVRSERKLFDGTEVEMSELNGGEMKTPAIN
jgi:hypothetical protein